MIWIGLRWDRRTPRKDIVIKALRSKLIEGIEKDPNRRLTLSSLGSAAAWFQHSPKKSEGSVVQKSPTPVSWYPEHRCGISYHMSDATKGHCVTSTAVGSLGSGVLCILSHDKAQVHLNYSHSSDDALDKVTIPEPGLMPFVTRGPGASEKHRWETAVTQSEKKYLKVS